MHFAKKRKLGDLLMVLLTLLEEEDIGERVPQHDSVLTGNCKYKELMSSASVAKFRNTVRMTKSTFKKLLRKMKKYGLQNGRKICAGQKLCIFL